MIREIDVSPAWTGVISADVLPGMCRVGRVIGRSDQNGVTLMWRIELLTGRVVRVPAESVKPLPSTLPGDLDIPPVPACATIGAVVVSPTPAVRGRDLERRARVLGVSMAEMIEAGFVGSRQS